MQTFYLVAASAFEPAQSRVVATVTDPVLVRGYNDDEETDREEFDDRESALLGTLAFDLTGGGYRLECAVQIASPADALYEAVAARQADGETAWFDAHYTVKQFPLIENRFEPGIYEFDDVFYTFIEARSKAELSEALHYLFEGWTIDEYKVVCEADCIKLIVLPENQVRETALRLPFTYFDFRCPFCRAQVAGREPSQPGGLGRAPADSPSACRHYLGRAVYADGYDDKELQNLNRNCRLVEDELFVEIGIDQLRRATVVEPSPDPLNSYWNCDAESYENETRIERFFFLPDEDELQAKERAAATAASFAVAPVAPPMTIDAAVGLTRARLNITLERQSLVALNQQLFEQILRAIESGELAPLAFLPGERELAEQYRIGRQVVRDAYRRLRAAGIARSGSRVGWQITAEAPAAVRRLNEAKATI